MVLENDIFLDEVHLKLREEVKDLVKWVDPKLIRAMDAEEVDYPHEFYREAGRRNLLGLRFPKKYGGRELDWIADCVALEEVTILGAGIGCSYAMPIIVGEAINTFGTEEHKKKYLVPMLKGELVSAEGLTEPRGGSDFFGTNTIAEKDGDVYYLTGEKRFIAGAKAADLFLLYAR
ncbi:MAG: acyl-CoA dehydrogenase family protein, partial [Candidatus Freyarchaeota archaeon]